MSVKQKGARPPQDFANAVIARAFLRGASSNFLLNLTAEQRQSGVTAAVRARDTKRLFGWLMTMLSYQGISDQVAEQFVRTHGQISWTDAEAIATLPACPKLTSYWHFEDCNYRKSQRACSRSDLFHECLLPRQALRNGRLNQMAASLYLFIRDIADGDLIGWLDARLRLHADQAASVRTTALIEPLRNVYGVSDKVLAMLLSALLLGTDRRRRLWFETGASFVVVDTLVHNYLHRSGALTALGANHPYGQKCYAANGCAAIIQNAARAIDARVFGPELPHYFPRFVQHAIWRLCAMDGLDVCNGNRVDDRRRCDNRYCLDFTVCMRESLVSRKADK